MASVTLPKGIYLRGSVYWFNYQVNGERTHESLQTKDLATAIQRAADRKRRAAVTHAGPRAIDALIARFVADKSTDANFSKRTAQWADDSLRQFCKWAGSITPASVTRERCVAFREHLVNRGLAPTTTNSYLRALSSFMSWAVARGLATSNPVFGTLIPRAPGHAKTEFCTVAQRDLLLRNAPNREMALILHLGFFAGLRRNEIVEAMPHWADMTGHILVVQERPESPDLPEFRLKDREKRAIPMHPRLVAFLEDYPMRPPFLLLPEVGYGQWIYRYDFRRPFSDYVQSQGLSWVTPHTMRRTFASLLAQAGVSLYKIAKWLGDTIETTERHYAHLQAHDSDIALEATQPPQGRAGARGSSGRKRRPAKGGRKR